VTQVLDRTFGPGEAIASVDVVLNLDQSRVTTEEVLPAKGGTQEGSPAGVAVRERQTIRENGAGAGQAAPAAAGRGSQAGSVTTIESDYQVGRRVEQLVTAGGTVDRMTVAVVVKKALTDTQLGHLKEVIGLAAGYNSERGDAIVVHTLSRIANDDPARASVLAPTETAVMAEATPNASGKADEIPPPPSHALPLSGKVVGVIALLLGAVLASVGGFVLQHRRVRQSEREQVLRNIRQWINVPRETEEIH